MTTIFDELDKIEPHKHRPKRFSLNMTRTIILQTALKEEAVDKFEENKESFEKIYPRKSDIFNQVARDGVLFLLFYIGALDEDIWESQRKNILSRISLLKKKMEELKKQGDW